MAGSRPGPAKGHGGAPRKKNTAPNGEGYVQHTYGPPGKGVRKYEHRVKAGAKPGQVVDHKNANRQDNSRGNLRPMSKSRNTALSNKARGRRG